MWQLFCCSPCPVGNAHAPCAQLTEKAESAVRLAPPGALAARSTVHCRLHLPPAGTLIQLKGEIVWSDGTGVIGLQIQGVSARDRRELEGWLSTRAIE